MAKLSILAGATSVSLSIFIADSSSTTGAGLTGLVFNTSSLTAYYALPSTASVAITLATLAAVNSAFSSGGFKEIDATNMPGWYRFDIPNAAIASGRFVAVHFKGATNMAPLPLEIELTATNNQSATSFITGVNALAPPTNWNLESIDSNGRLDIIKVAGTTQTARDLGASVLLSTGTGTGQLDFTSGVVKSNVTQWLGTAASTPTVAGVPNVNAKTWNDLATVALPLIPTTAGRTLDVSTGGEAGVDWANVGSPTTSLALTGTTIAVTQKVDVDTIKTNPVVNGGTITFPTTATLASTTNVTAGTITTVTNLTNAPTAGDLTATMKTSVTTAATAATPTAAAVTGAVGSVTGNVGGNVVGSVASVTAAVSLSAGDTPVIRSNTAQAGGASTITLDASASATDSIYNGEAIKITSGTGVSQTRTITAYNGTTKVATVDRAWQTAPDNTSVFSILATDNSKTNSSLEVISASVTGAVASVTGNVGGNVTGSVASVVAGVTLTASQLFVKKNTQYAGFEFIMTDSTTHAPVTGLTVAAKRSIDGAAFAACANAVAEVSDGVYKITLAAADVNGTDIMLQFTATAADPCFIKIVTQA